MRVPHAQGAGKMRVSVVLRNCPGESDAIRHGLNVENCNAKNAESAHGERLNPVNSSTYEQER